MFVGGLVCGGDKVRCGIASDTGDQISWFRDEEFARETLVGPNPSSIKLVTGGFTPCTSSDLHKGMSDLCSPMIILLDNEADAFWCFERLMRRLLSNLSAITQVVDPKLHQHLETLGGLGKRIVKVWII